MNDYVIDHRGVRHDAVIAGTGTYHKRQGEGSMCAVALADTPEHPSYDMSDTTGCTGLRTGDRVTIVVDAEGWLARRLSIEVTGVAPWLVRTCAGLLSAVEAFVLYGRLRRRRI
ncbi:hypothetical protein ACWGLF_11225 [Streptomyces puniciscabiei]